MGRIRHDHQPGGGAASPRRAARHQRPAGRVAGSAIPQRQVQREAATLAGLAGEADLAAEQRGDLAADRQPEPGSAEPPAGGHVRLLERLEDDRLLVGWRCRCPYRRPRS